MHFNEIYTSYWNKVFRLCMGFVNDAARAKDLAQDTFVIVWQQMDRFRHEAGIGTWIYRIATNQCLRQIEKDKRLPTAELKWDVPEDVHPEKEQQSAFLYRCISELPETDRIIISLELEDVKQAEIAAIVGISETNVRVKIFRIKEKLTEKFKKHDS